MSITDERLVDRTQNGSGPTLPAPGPEVTQSVTCRCGFQATGADPIRLEYWFVRHNCYEPEGHPRRWYSSGMLIAIVVVGGLSAIAIIEAITR